MSWGEFQEGLVLGAEKGSPQGGAWAAEEGAGTGLENSMYVRPACPSTVRAAVRGGSNWLFTIPHCSACPAVGTATWGAGRISCSGSRELVMRRSPASLVPLLVAIGED